MIAIQFFVVFLVAVCFSYSYGKVSPRMMGGAQIDTKRRFPASVNIQPLNAEMREEEYPRCSGSILNEQWILTSADCVSRGETLRLDFDKLHINSTIGSFSIIINNIASLVTPYPTLSDDIAVIEIPSALRFTATLAPISLSSKSRSQMLNKLAVSPGFDAQSQKKELTYSMMTVVSDDVCKRTYGAYDEFQQICTMPYRTYKNTPCATDSGTGLIADWPAAPQLIGIYSSRLNDCNSNAPSVYLDVAKYQPWIESIIGESMYTSTTAGPWYTTTAVST